MLNRLLAAYPALNVHMRLSDERVHLVTEGLDAVIRIGSLDDSGLVARQFDHQHLVLCSSPPYVKIHGALRAVEEVEKRSVIVFRMPASGRERPLEFVDDGERKRSRCGTQSRFALSHGDAVVEAVLQGAGIAQVPERMVTNHIRQATLVEELPGCRPAPLPVSVLTPGARMMPPRVRSFIDALLDEKSVTLV